MTGAPSNVVEQIAHLYGTCATNTAPDFVDFHLNVKSTSVLRQFFRPQLVVEVEGARPFNPIHAKHLLPSIEWSMNWAVAAFEHTKLLFHSSVVVRDGKAIVFPATSGSGKTTLATYLGGNGWQMFSDEMSVFDLDSGHVIPFYRPASLKNNSIDIIRATCTPHAFSPTAVGTHKGDMAHAMLYDYDQYKTFKPSPVECVIFPLYQPGRDTMLRPLENIQCFSAMLRHNFNYNILGATGFDTLSRVVNGARHYHLMYSELADANRVLRELL